MLGPENTTPLTKVVLSLLSTHEWVVYILDLMHKWSQSISDPKQFLFPFFQPTDTQIIDGLEFYFPLLVFATLLNAPFLLGGRSEFVDKIRLLASSVVGLLLGLVTTLSWHFAFWLMGGGASFAGTYLTSVYAGAPYVPLITVSSLILYGALPYELRPLALNPATTQKAMQLGLADPRTNNGAIVLGSLLVLGLSIWMSIVTFRCMSFIHSLGGWRLIVAILLSLVISGFVVRVFQFMQSTFFPPPGEPPTSSFPPSSEMPTLSRTPDE